MTLPDLSRTDCVGNISYWSNVLEDAPSSPVCTEDVVAFLKAVAAGEEQLDRSEGAEYSRDLINKLADAARKSIGSAKPIDPDVVP